MVADDPDDRDNEYSIGDTITVLFSHDTDMPDVTSKANIDALLKFIQDGQLISLGAAFSGSWNTPAELVIRMVDIRAEGAVPQIGRLQAQLYPNVIHVDGDPTSVNSVEISEPLKGSFGNPVALAMVYYLLPTALFVGIFIIGVYLRHKNRVAGKVKGKTAGMAMAPVVPDQPWQRPPAMVAMRDPIDPFAAHDKAEKERRISLTQDFSPRTDESVNAPEAARRESTVSTIASTGFSAPRSSLSGPPPAFKRPSFGGAARQVRNSNAFSRLPPGMRSDPLKGGGPQFLPPAAMPSRGSMSGPAFPQRKNSVGPAVPGNSSTPGPGFSPGPRGATGPRGPRPMNFKPGGISTAPSPHAPKMMPGFAASAKAIGAFGAPRGGPRPANFRPTAPGFPGGPRPGFRPPVRGPSGPLPGFVPGPRGPRGPTGSSSVP